MTRDAADARISVEDRHRAARAMVDAAKAASCPLADTIDAALRKLRAHCLDGEDERMQVRDALIEAIAASGDAVFIRAVLGDVASDRNARLHSHGALSSHLAEASWRLAGGSSR